MDAVMAFLDRMWASRSKQSDMSYKVRYSTLLWLFMAGSIAGFVLEGLWCLLLKGHWEHHAATVWGPFCIIYGIGAVVVYLLSAVLKSRHLLLQFAAFTVSGAAVEYFGSLFQELCFGSVSWDYSGHMWNLGGRVSLKMALIWGLLGILLMRFAIPLIHRLFEKTKGRGWRIVCVGLTAFMAANLLITTAAVVRWRARAAGNEAGNPVARWLDDACDDQAMKSLFPNMQFTAE